MQSLVPGLSVSDTLILAEKLPAPPDAAYQVWHALNRQVGQLVIIRVYADGRVESIENSPAATSSPVSAAPPVSEPPPVSTWNVSPPNLSASIPPSTIPGFNNVVSPTPMPVPNVPVQPTMSPQSNPFRSTDGPIFPPVRKGSKRWLRYVLTGTLLVSIATAGYIYRKPLRSYWRSASRSITRVIRSKDKTPSDTIAKKGNNSTTPNPNADTVTLETLPPPPVDPNEPPTKEPSNSPSEAPITAITAKQAARLLSLISTIPAEKHPAIFADAQLAFTSLRQSSGRQSYIDSLYVFYRGRGAQSAITYDQNGDPVSKQYAIDWYQTAYALKPGTDLQERIARLNNRAQKKQLKPVRESGQKGKVIFEKDPEVNR